MNAKEYLRQISILNAKIEHRLQELEQIKESAISTHSPDNGGRVQTSGKQDPMAVVDKYLDMEKDIQHMMDEMINKRHEIIERIHSVKDERYMRILYKRYVEFKTFEQISCEMGYDYKYVCKLHGYALKEISEDLSKEHE